MTKFSDFDIYLLFSVNGIGNRKINRILKSENQCFKAVLDIIDFTPDEIDEYLPGLYKSDIAALKALDIASVKCEYDALIESETDIITLSSRYCPIGIQDILNEDAPPILFCYGNLENMLKPGVAIVGTRFPSQDGTILARSIVEGLNDKNISIISGGAKGIDRTSHASAIDMGLSTTLIAPFGINHFLKSGTLDFPEDKALVVSQFHPNSVWRSAFAMIRNKLICALSKGVIVVEAGEKGGSVNAGMTALELNIPLYVVSPNEFKIPPPGNRYLISKGGRELFVNSELDKLKETIK